MTREKLEALIAALGEATADERRRILEILRAEFPIHDLERKWNTSAELILEAIARSSDLTHRGIRGVIAEAAFHRTVVIPLADQGWVDKTPAGDHPFDFLLSRGDLSVRVQVKLQRLEKQVPKLWKKGKELPPTPIYVVETQKTRSGTDSKGQSTRPYRFGEFDILAVAMHPSSGDWHHFRYTVANWLLPRVQDKKLINVFQPVPAEPNDDWSSDFFTTVDWLRKNRKKKISG